MGRIEPYPWQRRHVQGGPLHAFSNYALSQENEIGKMSSTNMCQGVSFAHLVSMIPEHLRPSNELFMRMVSESSQKERSVEVVLDTDSDVSLCCQYFIDFWEHHLHPWMVKKVDLNKYPHPDNYLQETIDRLNETNCASLFQMPGLDYVLRDIQRQDDLALQRAQGKQINDVFWWAHQFNECLEGRDFDFSDYREETLGTQ